MPNQDSTISRTGKIWGNKKTHGNIACATENILKFVEKYFCLLGSKFSFNNNVFWVGQSKRHLLRRILNLCSHMPIIKKYCFSCWKHSKYKLTTNKHCIQCFWICWETFFLVRKQKSEVGKHGNIDRKHNVSATIFPSFPRLNGLLTPKLN